VSSNIWRYNEYKDLKAVFAPDVSHIYMSVVAGLSEIGFNGLALTPEYGARNRFITVITNAEIDEDPLIAPGTICDGCMLCRKHCPAQALSKEINGEHILKIADYEYRFPNKNLWRCSWGEHFDLDLDLDIPEVVTEEVIMENVAKYGIRAGEMGQCLKFCVPKNLRTFDREYSRTPMRKSWASVDDAIVPRGITDRLLARAMSDGADNIIVTGTDELKERGIDINSYLPGAKSAITLVVDVPDYTHNFEFYYGAGYQLESLCYDLARSFDDMGFRTLTNCERVNREQKINLSDQILAGNPAFAGKTVISRTVLTRMALPSQFRGDDSVVNAGDFGDATDDLTADLLNFAKKSGADLAGVSSVKRMNEMAEQLKPHFNGMEYLSIHDKSIRFTPCNPDVEVNAISVKKPEDHLPGAKSVLMFGVRYHKEVLKWAIKPPAESIGPYSFQTYITHWMGMVIGCKIVKRLQKLGYQAKIVADLHNTESVTTSPRGDQPDLFSNRFAAIAAGIGTLSVSGHLTTPQFGIRQRCMAIITDAPLIESSLLVSGMAEQCADCGDKCITACPSSAIKKDIISLSLEGCKYSFNKIDRKACDWVKKFAIMGDSGFKYLGSTLDIPAPAEITPENLQAAMRQHDPIKRYRPVVAEPCVIECPIARM
jgi:epoxyqueuosine reductase QueG